MKDIKSFIIEQIDYKKRRKYLESIATDILSYIAESSKNKPEIWDDTFSWEAKEYDQFEYWQDAKGHYDDAVEFVEEYANECAVLGWFTKDSFENTEKLLPKIVSDIIKDKGESVYKKGSNNIILWEKDVNKVLDVNKLEEYLLKYYEADDINEIKEYYKKEDLKEITCRVLKFIQYKNDNGTDYPQYWYLFILKIY